MTSLSDQESLPAKTTAVALVVALPLMGLVAAILVCSVGQRNEAPAHKLIRAGGEEAIKDQNPPAAIAKVEPTPPVLPPEAVVREEPSPTEPNPKPAVVPVTPPTSGLAAPEQKSREIDSIPPSRVEEATTRDKAAGILVEELSKETYNALTELKAVLESQSWEEAAALVASFDPEITPGLAPYLNDRTLLTSLSVAVELAREDYPQLRQALSEKLAALASLRVARAIRTGNPAAIAFAAVQFADSPAAAEAHRWLGDRALASGKFARAVTEYERSRSMPMEPSEDVLPRIRLAASMLGHDAGARATRSIQFGDVSMSPEEFEAIVAEMRRRGAKSTPEWPDRVPQPVAKPSGFASHVRSRLDGPVGERPQDDIGRRTAQLHVPWVDRQIATVVEGDVMYVANRFQVAAYKLTSGERIWQSQTPPGPMQRAQEWGLVPMRPLVVANRIFVRLLYSPSPLLVCLDKASGKLLWVGESRENEFLVSDPLLVDGQLIAFGVAIQPDQQGQFRFGTIDPNTGETVRERDLVQLRSTWGARACCEVVECEDGIAVVLGGVVLSVTADGNVRWVRKQNTVAADEDPRWVLQMLQRPLVKGGRLYIAQPGVKSVECLSAATGRQTWSAALPDIVGIVGLAGDLLVIRTERSLRGLELIDGTTRWEYSADGMYSFHLVDEEQLLIANREKVPNKSDCWQPRLSWLNPTDGETIATTVLTSLADSDPRLGPFVPYMDRLFTFFGRGQHDPTREIIELIPAGAAQSPRP